MKKLTVYPGPRALAVLGQSAPMLNQALECWAAVIARASADNSKIFDAAEWKYIADLLNGTLHEPEIGNPGELLASSVEDGAALDGLGEKWFAKTPAARVQVLAEKVRGLDYAHAWAAIVAVQWFWENSDSVSVDAPWWTLAFRRKQAEDK